MPCYIPERHKSILSHQEYQEQEYERVLDITVDQFAEQFYPAELPDKKRKKKCSYEIQLDHNFFVNNFARTRNEWNDITNE